MQILSAAVSAAQPDYVALAMVLALAVVVAILALRKHQIHKNKSIESGVEPIPAALPPQPAARGSAGQIKLHGVEPKTAAMLMAIVADKMGKPLNELRFISIKEID